MLIICIITYSICGLLLGGDNVLVGTYDRRLFWFDLDLSTKPYQGTKLYSFVNQKQIHSFFIPRSETPRPRNPRRGLSQTLSTLRFWIGRLFCYRVTRHGLQVWIFISGIFKNSFSITFSILAIYWKIQPLSRWRNFVDTRSLMILAF